MIAYNDRWEEVECWFARWNPSLDPQTDSPMFNEDWPWRFWQWEAKGNEKGEEYGVGSVDIDLNVFNGSVDDLDTWLECVDEPVDCCEELRGAVEEIQNRIDAICETFLLQNELNKVLENDLGTLKERMSLNEMITDNNYMAINEQIADLTSQFVTLDEIVSKNEVDIEKNLEWAHQHILNNEDDFLGVNRRIDDITIPETNHSHRKLFSWLWNKHG